MIRLKNLLMENSFWPDTIHSQGIKPGLMLTTYHGSSNKIDFVTSNQPIHLGTSEQVDTRIDSLWNHYSVFYEYKINIRLVNPYPKIMMDVDEGAGHTTEDFIKYGNYNEFIYHNTVEGYSEDPNNLSVFVVNIKKCLVNSKLIRVINTKYDASGIDTPGDPNM
jgi:hypothetical protein